MKKELTEEQKQARREIRRKFNHMLTDKYKVGMVVVSKQGDKGAIKDIKIDSRVDKPCFEILMDDGTTRLAMGRHIRKYLIE